MVWLLIKDNKIDNCIVYDPNSNWTPPEGSSLVQYSSDLSFDIGWDWNDGNPTNPIPPQPPPETVTTEPTVI